MGRVNSGPDATSDAAAPGDAGPPSAGGATPLGAEQLFADLYRELHRLARREAARQGGDHAASPTTLLHEAYLDMARRDALAFPDHARFLAYAARAMRTLAIDRARAHGAQKRGGGFDITDLDTETAESVADVAAMPEIGVALDELAALEPALATVVELRFFCGLSMADIAGLQGTSERTVQRQWEKARLLLFRTLGPS